MNGVIKPGRLRLVGVTLLLLLIITSTQRLYADDLQIAVVKSSENNYFSQTIETLVNLIDDNAQFKVINENNFESSSEILQKANVIITLGAGAASKISSQSSDKLIINAYITLEQAQQFKHSNQRRIFLLLNQPLERYLVFSHHLLNLTNLALINRSVPIPISRQQKTLNKLNLKVNQYQLGDDNTVKRLLPTVRQLVTENDALLMLPDKNIYNRDTLKGILLTTYRSRTPVISYSPGHVASGALAAIYSSPVNIGQQLAGLINLHHKDKLKIKDKIAYGEYYSIAINHRVAHSLGLDIPNEDKLRKLIDETTR